jgi:GTP-binding protein
VRRPKALTSLSCGRYIADDELVEVTPKIVRLRKKKLDPTERKKLVRQTL